MSMRSWIRNVLARTASRPPRKAPSRARLVVEALEDRRVPATFTVTNVLDFAPLAVRVTANNPNEPVAGGLVTFTAPTSGASATLTGNPAIIQANGTASVTARANSWSGSYTVSVTTRGITTPAGFFLTNSDPFGGGGRGAEA